MKSCLIVDDSKVVRMVARKIMEGFDFVTAEAEDGQQALDQCRAKMPDLVLLDWKMPVMSGLDFLKEVRAIPDIEQPVVMFCTTENDVEQIQLAIDAGANEYIMKPFDSEIVESKLLQVGLI
jgi:two-component system chemotaxis response regulator CheY